jgi:YbbR domain-containing protein
MNDDSSKGARLQRPSTSAPGRPDTPAPGRPIDPGPPTWLPGEDNGKGSEASPETVGAAQVRAAAGDGPSPKLRRDESLAANAGSYASRSAPQVADPAPGPETELAEATAEDLFMEPDVQASPARPARARRLPSLPRIYVDERVGRILLSMVLAILLWFYVASLENPTRSTRFADITIDVRGVSGQLKVVNTLPTVSAFVQAPQNVLSTLGRADIHPYVDLSGLTEGVHEVPVRAEVSGGRGNEVEVTLSPATVQVQIELQVSRIFPVTADVIGAPAFGYGMDPPQVSPGQVQLTGPKDAINRVAAVKVQVDVEGKASTQQGLKAPIAYDSSGVEIKGLVSAPQTVQVVVPLTLHLNYKVVTVRVPLVGQPATGYGVSQIVIDPTNITVCCSPTVLDALKFVEAKPVSITGTTTTVITTTELILPANVELYPGQPKTISVTVSVSAQQTSQQASVAIAIAGVTPGLSAVLSPNRLDVTLAGTLNQLQGLSPTDVRAVVNAQGRGPGTYSVKPDVTVPQGVRIVSTSPDTLTLSLIAPTPVPVPTETPSPTRTRIPEAIPSATQPGATPKPTPSAVETPPVPTVTPPVATPTPTPVAGTRTPQVLPTAVP